MICLCYFSLSQISRVGERGGGGGGRPAPPPSCILQKCVVALLSFSTKGYYLGRGTPGLFLGNI